MFEKSMRGCIGCGHPYVSDGDSVADSHGLCPKCLGDRFIQFIRTRQIREGNSPCFKTCEGYCDRNCCWRTMCTNPNPTSEDAKEFMTLMVAWDVRYQPERMVHHATL